MKLFSLGTRNAPGADSCDEPTLSYGIGSLAYWVHAFERKPKPSRRSPRVEIERCQFCQKATNGERNIYLGKHPFGFTIIACNRFLCRHVTRRFKPGAAGLLFEFAFRERANKLYQAMIEREKQVCEAGGGETGIRSISQLPSPWSKEFKGQTHVDK